MHIPYDAYTELDDLQVALNVLRRQYKRVRTLAFLSGVCLTLGVAQAITVVTGVDTAQLRYAETYCAGHGGLKSITSVAFIPVTDCIDGSVTHLLGVSHE